jgi:hypothetical protein
MDGLPVLHEEGMRRLTPAERTLTATALPAPPSRGDMEGKQPANCINKGKVCSIETSPVSILQRTNCIKVSCNILDFAQKDFAKALMRSIVVPAKRVF